MKAGRGSHFPWRYAFNFASTLPYLFNRSILSNEATRIAQTLKTEGVAITSIQQLPTTALCFDELVATVGNRNECEIRSLAQSQSTVEAKPFTLELLGSSPTFDLGSIYARFALQDTILQIANAYFGMYTCLRYYNVWHTFPTNGQASQSQLWHRDREDFKILKVFVYLSDVEEGAGPLTYARGSQRSRRFIREPEYFVEGGTKRSYDWQMAAVIAGEQWLTATGPTGTIVFADTSGYHKGGLALDRDRLMYVCMFTSPSSESRELFTRNAEAAKAKNKAIAFALSRPRSRQSV
jgi:hypothetical protein